MKTLKKGYKSKRQTYSKRVNHSKIIGSCVSYFLEFLMMIKLYHWRTYSFAQHKATDELYGSLNENIDKFVEVLLGKKTGMRITTPHVFHISAHNYLHKIHFIREIEKFRDFLVDMELNPITYKSSDLLSIRDDILADVNKFLYLMSLS